MSDTKKTIRVAVVQDSFTIMDKARCLKKVEKLIQETDNNNIVLFC